MNLLKEALTALHERVLTSPELSELRRVGPLLGSKEMIPLIWEYTEAFHLSEDDRRELIADSVTEDFWKDIPNK